VSFATNGMALTEARADLMLDAGVMGEFVVSLDASTSQIFQLMRPACDFETVVRNVRYYTSRASELPSDARRGVTLNMTVCEANLRDVPGLVDLATDVGARRVHYNHLNEGLTHSVEAPDGTKWSYAEQKNFRDPQLHDELVLEAYRRGERQGISVTFVGEPFLVRRGNDIASARGALRNYDHTVPLKVWSEPWHSPTHQPIAPGVPICRKPWKEVVIQPGGEVRRCYFHDETRFALGNVTGGDFMALWNSQAMIREREQFLSHSISRICGQSAPCLHRSRR
jgi:MoaA/NifB/PqqE/SkfB family radical SAM enzyme